MFVAMVLLSLLVEECEKKSQSKETSATTIPDSLKRYPFRSAIIELHYGGSASGKEMIYIDVFGLKEATLDSLTMKMMEMEKPSYKMQIRNRDSLFQIDFVRGTATKGANAPNATDEKAMSSMGEEMAKGMGMKKKAKEDVVAGQKCTVWTSEEMGTESWLWNNITLKSKARVGDDTILLETVALNVDVPVPPSTSIPQAESITRPRKKCKRCLMILTRNLERNRSQAKKRNDTGHHHLRISFVP